MEQIKTTQQKMLLKFEDNNCSKIRFSKRAKQIKNKGLAYKIKL